MKESKYPAGLFFLVFTEFWERFGYYLMIGIFTLYLKDVETGFAMTEAEASDLYGTFIALVFLTPFIGGLVADRYFGYKKSIVVGGLMMGVGYLMMGIHSLPMLYLAMTLVIVGNGFFKPNISSMVTNLYPKEEKSKLDTAFTIFYMGINVGAFLGQFICPALGDVVDANGTRDVFAFKWGFFAAGVAMLIGTLTFYLLKDKYVVTPEGRPLGGLPKHNIASDYEEGESQKAVFSSKSLMLAVIVGAGAYAGLQMAQRPIDHLPSHGGCDGNDISARGFGCGVRRNNGQRQEPRKRRQSRGAPLFLGRRTHARAPRADPPACRPAISRSMTRAARVWMTWRSPSSRTLRL